MKPRHQAARAALDLIERFEGYRRTAARLEDGRWTVGYGHTKTARPGAEVSQADAEALLIYDLIEVTAKLNEWILTPLTQNQFDALTAFAFNIGLDNFRHSGVLRRINEGQLLHAACAMEMWRRADFEGERIVIDALVRRRAAEKALFLTPTGGFLPVPTPILKPQLDHDHAGAAPAHKPVELSVPLNGERAAAERIGPLEDYRPIPPMQADESPSASEVAATALIERLKAIPAEDSAPEIRIEQPAEAAPEPEPAWAPEPPPEPELEPESEQSFALTPPPVELEPEPELAPVHNYTSEPASADAEDAPLFPAEPLGFDEFDSQRVAHHEFDALNELDEIQVERVQGLNPVIMWFGLAILGLVVFAAGIFWGFSARQATGGGVFSVHVLIGWVLGIAGIGCVATAVYFLLERLGGREEQ